MIFVFFVYVVWAFGSKNALSKMLPPGSKSVRKKRKNQGEVFLRFLRTHFPPRIRNNTTKAFCQRSETRHFPNNRHYDTEFIWPP